MVEEEEEGTNTTLLLFEQRVHFISSHHKHYCKTISVLPDDAALLSWQPARMKRMKTGISTAGHGCARVCKARNDMQMSTGFI